jgi:hypothetical protein
VRRDTRATVHVAVGSDRHLILHERGILVGRDEDGYLLQTFTRPLGTVPPYSLSIEIL